MFGGRSRTPLASEVHVALLRQSRVRKDGDSAEHYAVSHAVNITTPFGA